MKRLVPLLLCSCAGYSLPQEIAGQMRQVELDHPLWTPYGWRPQDFDMRVDGQLLHIYLEHQRYTTLRREKIRYRHETVISTEANWSLKCVTQQYIDGGFRGAIVKTTEVQTECRSIGELPNIDLSTGGWPRVEGLLEVNGTYYRILASAEYESRPAALIISRGPTTVLVVAETDRIWLRQDLDRKEQWAAHPSPRCVGRLGL